LFPEKMPETSDLRAGMRWPPTAPPARDGICGTHNHPLQPIQIVETIPDGLLHGAQQWFARILAHEAQQLPQGQRDHLTAPLLQAGHILAQLGRSG
jgi:hypothetical protein